MMYMGTDQYGNSYHDLGKFPRKGLLEQLGAKSARKMYETNPDGDRHIGYIIRGLWIRIFKVEFWYGRA
jgi:hypothetical protein